MKLALSRLLLIFLAILLRAAEPDPAAIAAFDHYAQLTEQDLAKPVIPHDFLWIDRHAKEQSLVWLSQPVIAPGQTLDQGHAIAIPGATFQHWIGTILLEFSTFERARDFILNYADYKSSFKDFFVDSKLEKRDGDRFDGFLRLTRKQFSTVMLNIKLTSNWVLLDPKHAYIICRYTHIGEVEHPGKKKEWDEERPAADAHGYLWRQNIYWRIEQTADGVFVEIQSLTLSRPPQGALSPSRMLNGFVQDFPRQFIDGMLDDLRAGFPRPKP